MPKYYEQHNIRGFPEHTLHSGPGKWKIVQQQMCEMCANCTNIASNFSNFSDGIMEGAHWF